MSSLPSPTPAPIPDAGLQLLTPLRQLAERPLYAPIARWLQFFGGDAPASLHALNDALDHLATRPLAGSGLPVWFARPQADAVAYEERIHATGAVETRADNWHDFFNALAWLAYPRAKRSLNERHHVARQAERSAGNGRRGALRDALTQFDECGLAVASASAELMARLRAHEWKRLFWHERPAVLREMRFFVFGHATWEQLRRPYFGLTAKAVLIDVTSDWLRLAPDEQRADMDGRLAEIFSRGDLFLRPRDFQPVPLLGIPGVVEENAEVTYYDDTRQFCPRRKTQYKKGPAGAGPEMEAEVRDGYC